MTQEHLGEQPKWQGLTFLRFESFHSLPPREKNAVQTTIHGLRMWSLTGEEPKPIRVTATEERPFNLKGYANVLDKLGIGISETFEVVDARTVTFKPHPYDPREIPQRKDSILKPMEEPQKELKDLGLDIPNLGKSFRGSDTK